MFVKDKVNTSIESYFGLSINQSKSELLWRGSLRHRKDSVKKLNSDEPFNALGVYILNNDELATTKQFLLQEKDKQNAPLIHNGDKDFIFCLFAQRKISVFQYKIIHNILYTNSIYTLYKMKKATSSILHILYEHRTNDFSFILFVFLCEIVFV